RQDSAVLRAAGEARRSERQHSSGQPVRRGRDEARRQDRRATPQPGHVHRAADGRERASRLLVEKRSERLHLSEELADALVSRQADAGRARRSRRVSRVAERIPTMTRRRVVVQGFGPAAVIALGLGVVIHAQQPVTFDRILHADREPQNWLTYSGGLFSHRYSLLTQITPV